MNARGPWHKTFPPEDDVASRTFGSVIAANYFIQDKATIWLDCFPRERLNTQMVV